MLSFAETGAGTGIEGGDAWRDDTDMSDESSVRALPSAIARCARENRQQQPQQPVRQTGAQNRQTGGKGKTGGFQCCDVKTANDTASTAVQHRRRLHELRALSLLLQECVDGGECVGYGEKSVLWCCQRKTVSWQEKVSSQPPKSIRVATVSLFFFFSTNLRLFLSFFSFFLFLSLSHFVLRASERTYKRAHLCAHTHTLVTETKQVA